MNTRHHIPQRTCVACRQVRPKRELIRLVRFVDGNVKVDTSGKKAGRGAYLCQSKSCWEVGLKGGRLEHTLRTNLTLSNRQQLMECKINLDEELTSGYGK
ncbi:RNase P modulator RnpM [Chloroflexota bacterium]